MKSLADTVQRCVLCGTESQLIIEHLGVCSKCLGTRVDQARSRVQDFAGDVEVTLEWLQAN